MEPQGSSTRRLSACRSAFRLPDREKKKGRNDVGSGRILKGEKRSEGQSRQALRSNALSIEGGEKKQKR